MCGAIRPLRAIIPLAAIAAAFLVMPSPDALAQTTGRAFRDQHIRLTNQDFEIVRKIVHEDFTGKPEGTTRPWSNPESRNSGTLTLLETFQSRGRECRRVRYVMRPGPNQPATHSSTYDLTNCRLADGTWKIDETARPDKPR